MNDLWSGGLSGSGAGGAGGACADAGPVGQRVLRARVRLMLEHPFLAQAVARFPLVEVSDRSRCAVMATDGEVIAWNPEGLRERSDSDIVFIFAHEVLHGVLGHIDRRGHRNPRLWNLAIDHATNLMLIDFGLQPPADAIASGLFRGLAAEVIYARLENEAARGMLARHGAGSAEALDMHAEPGSLAGLVRAATERLTRAELSAMRRDLVREIAAQLKGDVAGRWMAEVRVATETKTPWRQVLASYAQRYTHDDYRMWPFNRKHLWRGWYLPSVGTLGLQHVVVAIDTSGSMSDAQISTILGEVVALCAATRSRITVIQCDAAIRSCSEHDPWDEPAWVRSDGSGGRRVQIHGRGGTDFEPVFHWIEERRASTGEVPDLLVYATDGIGSYPASAPQDYPVLWLLSGVWHGRPRFGTSISLDTP